MSENNGITKEDLLDMEARLADRLPERIVDRVEGRIDAFEERLKNYVFGARHDLGTRIVAQFYK
jgi:hypothetical protein